jgi:Tol biopolymer transport system component
MSAMSSGSPWALSDNVLAYGSSAALDRALVWVDREGHTQTVPVPNRPFISLNLSPNGRRVALAVTEAKSDIWIYDLEQGTLTQATADGQTLGALWAPDGQRITTFSAREGKSVFSARADGTGVPERLLTNVFWPAAWTKDSRRLVVMTLDGDIAIADFKSGGTLRPLIHTPANELGGRLSPDEHWLAYFSNATGAYELWVARFPEGEPSVRVSRTGAREAVWSHDGHELFFRSANGRQLLSVAINPGTNFSFAPPRLLFEGDYFFDGGPGLVNYDVSQDGKRFLMLQRVGTGSGHLNVVQGWSRMIPTSGR